MPFPFSLEHNSSEARDGAEPRHYTLSVLFLERESFFRPPLGLTVSNASVSERTEFVRSCVSESVLEKPGMGTPHPLRIYTSSLTSPYGSPVQQKRYSATLPARARGWGLDSDKLKQELLQSGVLRGCLEEMLVMRIQAPAGIDLADQNVYDSAGVD